MKKLQFTAAVFMLALASCSEKEEVKLPSIENEPIVVHATSEGSSTRTALTGDDFTQVVWQTGDAMNFHPCYLENGKITSKVPGDATLQQGTKLVTTGSGSSADFVTEDGSEVPTTTTIGTETADANTYLAITPYLDNEGTASSKIKLANVDSSTRGTISFTMPTTQMYVENSYDPAVAFAFAKSTDVGNMKFSNQFGVLRLNITGTTEQKVTSISVTSVSASGYLSGTVNACTVEEYEAGSKLAVSGTKSQTITMTCGEGVALSSEPTMFNIVLVPFTGVTVDITYSDGTEETVLSKVTNSPIERSVLTNMPVIDLTLEDLGGGTESEGSNSTEDMEGSEGTWEE
ncbi:MAG: hypothetical protein R3Y26_06280 [Rikenellaceae bacterium]